MRNLWSVSHLGADSERSHSPREDSDDDTPSAGRPIVALLVAGLVVLASADPPLVAKAKEAGFPAKNCQYCHVSALPKKDTFKPDDLNERGKFLAAEKDKQQAKAVNVEWLKNYPGGKEQK